MATALRKGIDLAVGQELVADFRSEPGPISQVIAVEASAPMVSPRGGAFEQVVSRAQIERLPLNGRDFTQLILLRKGVVQSRGSTRDIDVGFGTKVSVGGVFDMVAKSGGNDPHGSLFAFHRNDNLDARNFFDLARPKFRRNQLGGSLGGPAIRNRTFLFGSYEGFRESKGVTLVPLAPDEQVPAPRQPQRAPYRRTGPRLGARHRRRRPARSHRGRHGSHQPQELLQQRLPARRQSHAPARPPRARPRRAL